MTIKPRGWMLTVVASLWGAGLSPAAAPFNADFVKQVNLDKFRLIAVQHDGCFKTFDTLARSALRNMSADDSFEWETDGKKNGIRQDAAFTYLDMLFRPEVYRDARIVYIKEKVVRDKLIWPLKDQLDKATLDAIFKDGRVSISFLLRPEVKAVLDDLNRDVMRTAKKVDAIVSSAMGSDPQILQRAMRIIPPPGTTSIQERWFSIEDLRLVTMPTDSAHAGMSSPRALPNVSPELQQGLANQWNGLQQAWVSQDAATVNAAANALADQVQSINPSVYPAQSKLSLENWYYKYNKMMWSWAIYFFAVILLLMGIVYRWPMASKIGISFFVLGFAFHTTACGIRWYLAGRIPNSNMFEAVTAAAWFGCAVALFFELGPMLYQRRAARYVIPAMMLGGFVTWLGSLLIMGVPVGAWQQWSPITIAALIVFAIGCMGMVSLTVARRTASYQGVPLLAASATGMCALMCGQFMKNSLDSDIGRTMPVLNDLWLYVHTNMIIASYALIGLAFCTAALYLVGRMLTLSGQKAKTVWLCVLIPTIIIPLPALPDILYRITDLFHKGPNPTASTWPLTIFSLLPAWIPFLIVIGMYGIARLTGFVTGQLWVGATIRARNAWEGIGTPALNERDMNMMVLAGGMTGIAATSAYVIAHAGGSKSGGASPRFDESESRGISLARVFDGATMLLLELSFIMLWTGIIMGAIWADHSWGRPWGWDPKEVFALNTWIIFLILVHVRLKVIDKELWTAVLAVVGTSVMMFNWVVVNFFIVGLHSYA